MTPAPINRADLIVQLVVQGSGGLLLASSLVVTDTSYANFADAAANEASTPGLGGASQVVMYTFSYTKPGN